MKKLLWLLFSIAYFNSFSQGNDTVYTTTENSSNKKKYSKFKHLIFNQLEISTPLVLNTHHGEQYQDGTIDKNWFLPNGLGVKAGLGIQPEGGWIGLSANTGIDWKINPKMVVVPFFGNLRITFSFSDEKKINLQSGFGKGIALGRGALYSNYQRYSIGYENSDNFSVFAEVSINDFKSNPEHTFGSLSIGIGFRN